MKQSISLVTLGVSDYERSKAFYEALGWSAVLDIEETAFFQANGVVLVLWARDKLAADLGIEDDGASWGGIALAHNVASRGEVDEVIELARGNGAEITREPSETFYGGYAGGFRDLDGHVWEIARNPSFGLEDDGSVLLPER
jgi:uncharacterized protein